MDTTLKIERDLIAELRKAAEQIAAEGHAGWGNACRDAAQTLASKEALIQSQAAEIERMRQELNVASVGEFGAQSASRHLSALVDFERQVSERCMAVMKALMDAAEPVNNEFQDCHIDYAEYAKFVDAHAELLYVIKNGERPAALTTQPKEQS